MSRKTWYPNGSIVVWRNDVRRSALRSLKGTHAYGTVIENDGDAVAATLYTVQLCDRDTPFWVTHASIVSCFEADQDGFPVPPAV